MHWWWQALATIKQLLLHPADYYDYAISRREGGYAVLRTESRLGRLAELLRLRGQYRAMLIEIERSLAALKLRPQLGPTLISARPI